MQHSVQRRDHYLKLKKKLPTWLWDQEFECKFTLPHGAVFKNVEYGHYPEWLMNQIAHRPFCNGVDWNPVSHHWLVGGKWTPDWMNFVFLRCDDLGDGYAIDMNMGQFQAIAQAGALGNHITMEDSGINTEYTKWFRKMLGETRFNWSDQNYHYEEWDSAGLAKYQIVTYILQNGVTLWCDKSKFPGLAKEIGDCRWDADSDTPKLVKNPISSPHRLDAGLHAMSKKNRMDSTMMITRMYK